MTIICILAGGESRRFGQSKLLVHIDGIPILAWQAARLSQWTPDTAPTQLWLSLPFGNTPLPPGSNAYSCIIRDAFPFQGPLAGIASVLAQAPQSGIIAFVPADMPLILPQHLDLALDAMTTAAPPARRACFFDPSQNRIQPLPMLMDLAHAYADVVAAQAQDIHSPSALAKTPGTAQNTSTEETSRPFQSINTPPDMQAIAHALGKPLTVHA